MSATDVSFYYSPTAAKFPDGEIIIGKWVAVFSDYYTTMTTEFFAKLCTDYPPPPYSGSATLCWSRYDSAHISKSKSKWNSFIPGFDIAEDAPLGIGGGLEPMYLKNAKTDEIWTTCANAWRSHSKFIELVVCDLLDSGFHGISLIFVPTGAKMTIDPDGARVGVEIDQDLVDSHLLNPVSRQCYAARLFREKGIDASQRWIEKRSVVVPEREWKN